jgi:hypothetical protein
MGPCTKSFGEELSELLALPLSVCPPLLSSSLALCDHELQSLSAKHHKVHWKTAPESCTVLCSFHILKWASNVIQCRRGGALYTLSFLSQALNSKDIHSELVHWSAITKKHVATMFQAQSPNFKLPTVPAK